jgi:hypothetical protein
MKKSTNTAAPAVRNGGIVLVSAPNYTDQSSPGRHATDIHPRRVVLTKDNYKYHFVHMMKYGIDVLENVEARQFF